MLQAKFKLNEYNITLFYSIDHVIEPVVQCEDACPRLDKTLQEAIYFMALHNVKCMIVDGAKIVRQ